MLVLVLVLVFTWGLRPSNWVPKSVSVTSEAAQQPPARAHFVKQTEERRGGTLIIALPILTLTMLHCTTQHYLHGYLLSTLFTETRASAAENEETGTGEEIGRCYLRQIFSKRTFQGYLPRTVNLLHFKVGGWSGVWPGLGLGGGSIWCPLLKFPPKVIIQTSGWD